MRTRIELNTSCCQFCQTELTFADITALRCTDYFRPCIKCRQGFKFKFRQFIEKLRYLNWADLFRTKKPNAIELKPTEKKAITKAEELIHNLPKDVQVKHIDLAKIAPIVEKTDAAQEKAFQDFCHSVKKFGVVMAHTNGKDKVLLYPTDQIPEAIRPGNLPLYRIMKRNERRRK